MDVMFLDFVLMDVMFLDFMLMDVMFLDFMLMDVMFYRLCAHERYIPWTLCSWTLCSIELYVLVHELYVLSNVIFMDFVLMNFMFYRTYFDYMDVKSMGIKSNYVHRLWTLCVNHRDMNEIKKILRVLMFEHLSHLYCINNVRTAATV
jgi:hypothetical protein